MYNYWRKKVECVCSSCLLSLQRLAKENSYSIWFSVMSWGIEYFKSDSGECCRMSHIKNRGLSRQNCDLGLTYTCIGWIATNNTTTNRPEAGDIVFSNKNKLLRLKCTHTYIAKKTNLAFKVYLRWYITHLWKKELECVVHALFHCKD